MTPIEHKQAIEDILKSFGSQTLEKAALKLLETLGYQSDKRISLKPNSAQGFIAQFGQNRPFNPEQALVEDWQSVDLLFQLTDDEVRAAAGDNQAFLFESKGKYSGAIIESYLIFAIALSKPRYTRTQLSAITRAVNRLFEMPVMLLFRHGETLTLSIIRRRLHKREESKDVLEKVTLIKDVRFADPLRAHTEILYDLSIQSLHDEFYFHNFVGLHQAWEKRLDTYQLNERFYRDIANWYFWALQHRGVTCPRAVEEIRDRTEREKQRAVFFIRLLTRLIFCWFLQEKGLIPRDLFRRRVSEKMLKDFSPRAGTYYRAFLQNLFFATLNQEQDKRMWRKKYAGNRDGHRGITNLYRYQELVTDDDAFLPLLKEKIPFVNGGLFDCLDDVFTNDEKAARKKLGQPSEDVRLDDFSEEKDNELCLPNELFFGEERDIDLSDIYEDQRRKKEKVRGLIEILSRYKFTVEENTPLEQDIALDPELLGKVFENLLASYNEDTRTTARKALGAFYTPREVVSYMVDEALMAYLLSALEATIPEPASPFEPRLRQVFSSHPEHFQNPFTAAETSALIAAIDRVNILDPACGSGAFPMGALHRLVDSLQKLDPNNRRWKEQQLAKARRDRLLAEKMEDEENKQNTLREVESRIADIERSFDSRFHALDFARKLYLIENCIYGVDIQPIACQIAKLRFFIALIVDQHVDENEKNLGVRPLPNLETKIVAADSLIPIERRMTQGDMLTENVADVKKLEDLRGRLEEVRHAYFNARTPESKRKCRDRDAKLRQEIAVVLERTGLEGPVAKAMAAWNPYDQNHAAPFFDSEWMFGLPVGKVRVTAKSSSTLLDSLVLINETRGQMEIPDNHGKDIESGFDVVLGNPPYVRHEQIKDLKPIFKVHYDCFVSTADLYVYFYERSVRLLKPSGCLSFISSNSFLNSGFGEKLRHYLQSKTTIKVLIDFAETGVFTAITEPVIIVLQRGEKKGNHVVILKWNQDEKPDDIAQVVVQRGSKLDQSELKPEGWPLESPLILRLLEKLRTAGRPLGEIVQGKIYFGIKTGFNEAYVVDRGTRDELIRKHKSSSDVLKPFLRGRDIEQWSIKPTDQYLIQIESSENKEHPWTGKKVTEAEKVFAKTYPAIHNHFQQFKSALIKRSDQGHFYWELRSCDYWDAFHAPKIIYQDIARYYGMAWDDSGALLVNTCYFIPSAEKWLLACLLSNAMKFHVQKTLGSDEGGFIRMFTIHVEKFPIPRSTDAQKKFLEHLTDYILYLREHSAATGETPTNPRDPLMLGYWEQVLNGLVYELFFPDDLHSAGLHLFKLVEQAALPAIDSIAKTKRLAELRTHFERLYDTTHSLRGALFTLRSLEPIRIIEGEK